MLRTQVLEEHELSCMDLLHVNTDGVILTKRSKKLEWTYLLWLPFIKKLQFYIPICKYHPVDVKY
jgi:hypothetical protein